jgi:hypothetical protein
MSYTAHSLFHGILKDDDDSLTFVPASQPPLLVRAFLVGSEIAVVVVIETAVAVADMLWSIDGGRIRV